jgi:hypothetical protein
MTPTTPTTDALGFPTIPCRKCSGHGTIPAYNSIHHGTCYACSGSGRTYPTPTIKAAASDWAAKVKASTIIDPARKYVYHRPQDGLFATTGTLDVYPNQVTPGMVIRQRRNPNVEPAPWQTVATVRDTAEIIAGHLAPRPTPAPRRDRMAWWTGSVITFTDGTTIRLTFGSPDHEAQPNPVIVADARADAAHRTARYMARQNRTPR